MVGQRLAPGPGRLLLPGVCDNMNEPSVGTQVCPMRACAQAVVTIGATAFLHSREASERNEPRREG